MHIVIDRESPIAITEQVFAVMKRLILDGALAAGERLPPTRRLAEEIGVSRTVTVSVFERLAAEGFVEARQGSGTVVAPGALLAGGEAGGGAGGAATERPAGDRSPARRTSARVPAAPYPAVGFGPLRTDLIDFRTGVPDLREFPIAAWQRLQREVWDHMSPADLAYGAPEGREELRTALCSYLRVHRGVACSSDQIILTSGTTQAIALITSALATADRTRPAGDRAGMDRPCAILEDPVTGDIPRIIERGGMATVISEIDSSGFDAGRFPNRDDVRFVYVTPSHHYPLGVSMPIDRRVSLVEYARRHDCVLVEDDYDSEFRYHLPPVSTLFELDPSRVLYVGTFSKTLSPALRTAFIVSPRPTVRSLREAKWHADLHSASPDQLVLARFIEEGLYVRHMQRMRKIYEKKWQALRGALFARFHGQSEILGSPAGMHVAVRFPGVRFDEQLLGRLETAGVKFYPVSLHTRHPERWADCLVVGFGHLDAERIERGVGILAAALRHSSRRGKDAAGAVRA